MGKVNVFSAALLWLFSSLCLGAQMSWRFSFTSGPEETRFKTFTLSLPASIQGSLLGMQTAAVTSHLEREIPAPAQLESQVVFQADGSVKLRFVELAMAPAQTYTYLWTVSDGIPGTAISFREETGADYTEILHGNTPVYRHFTPTYDNSNHEVTKRSFHMIYGTDGGFITQDTNGVLYPHHRGIMMGWGETRVEGTDGTHDYWNCNGSHISHREYLSDLDVFGNVYCRKVAVLEYYKGTALSIIETRDVETWKAAPGLWIYDFHFGLESPNNATIYLEGNNAHAGMQFRAHPEVDEVNQDAVYYASDHTRGGGGKTWTTTDEWITCFFHVRGINYGVMLMNNTDKNPTPVFPTRDYGRFGIFYEDTLPPGEPYDLYYRFMVFDSDIHNDTSYAGLDMRYQGFMWSPEDVVYETAEGGVSVIQPGTAHAPEISIHQGRHITISAAGLTSAVSGLTVLRPDGRNILNIRPKPRADGSWQADLPSAWVRQGLYIFELKLTDGRTHRKKLFIN